ncbi:hypothetical protein T09_802 [Trichinella sp. T9]|nr:hypothetical protein T09_802 [Trichinella sp. T9]
MQSESLSLDNVQQARYYFHSELCKHDTHAISSNYETTGRTRKILQSREHFHRTEKEKSNNGTSKLVIRKQNDREPRLFQYFHQSYQIHFFRIHLIILSGILKNHILMYGHFGINLMHISITFLRLQD